MSSRSSWARCRCSSSSWRSWSTSSSSSPAARCGATRATPRPSAPWPSPSFAPGNCLDLDSLDDTSILQLPCAEPHDSEVISLLSFSGTAYPGEQTLYDDAVDQCYQPVAEAIPPRVDPINLYVDAFVPTQEEWDAGSRQASCLLVSDGEMTGSASAGDLVAPVG
ncbi:septum formation family protein [Salana multivorans]